MEFIGANIFGDALGWVKDLTAGQAMAVIIPLVMAYAVKEGKKLISKYIKTKENKELAEWIAKIADDLTDQLVAVYPENEWATRIDMIVDKLGEVISQVEPIKVEVAKRAVEAAIARKGKTVA